MCCNGMTDSGMNEPEPDREDVNESNVPLHAEFQHRAVTARIQADTAQGVFANAAIILSGQFEFVLDFIVRMGKPDRVMTRVVLPIPVVGQFVKALRESLNHYEQQFGPIAEIPKAAMKAAPSAEQQNAESTPGGFVGQIGPSSMDSGSAPGSKSAPPIDEIYDDLKLDDSLLGGAYANAVLLRYSPTEFCFDFVTNIYPKSSVNARVFMAIPQVPPLLKSMSHSFDQFCKRQQSPPPPPSPESDLDS